MVGARSRRAESPHGGENEKGERALAWCEDGDSLRGSQITRGMLDIAVRLAVEIPHEYPALGQTARASAGPEGDRDLALGPFHAIGPPMLCSTASRFLAHAGSLLTR